MRKVPGLIHDLAFCANGYGEPSARANFPGDNKIGSELKRVRLIWRSGIA
jgi:hypothetical protein